MRAYYLNERTLVLELSQVISSETSRQLVELQSRIEGAHLPIIETWLSYGSLAIQFDPTMIESEALESQIQPLIQSRQQAKPKKPNHVSIPVQYHDTNHDDMRGLCDALRLTAEEVSAIHSSATYTVAMLGFLPGFPYLIGLPASLHCPRKTIPSLKVPEGSVAIGGQQTGIYPHAGPGGWHVIGQMPLKLFEPPDSFLLKPGDLVKFESI